jgi:hypothetical protein
VKSTTYVKRQISLFGACCFLFVNTLVILNSKTQVENKSKGKKNLLHTYILCDMVKVLTCLILRLKTYSRWNWNSIMFFIVWNLLFFFVHPRWGCYKFNLAPHMDMNDMKLRSNASPHLLAKDNYNFGCQHQHIDNM